MAQRLVEIILKAKDEASGAFKSLGTSLGDVEKKQALFTAGAYAAAGALVVAGTAAYRFTSEMATLGDNLRDMSLRTGVATDTLQDLDFALQKGGGSTADLEVGVKRLARAMVDAREGTGQAANSFSRLGISVSDLMRDDGSLKDIADVLPLISVGLRNVSSHAEKIDIFQDLFGRGGINLLPAFAEGFAGVTAEMDKFGRLSPEMIRRSEELKDSQLELSMTTRALKGELAELLMPDLIRFIDRLNRGVVDLRASFGGDKHDAYWMREAREMFAATNHSTFDPSMLGQGDSAAPVYGPEDSYTRIRKAARDAAEETKKWAEQSAKVAEAIAAADLALEAATAKLKDYGVPGEYVGDQFFHTADDAERFREAMEIATEMADDAAWGNLAGSMKEVSEAAQYVASSIQGSVDGALYSVLATGQNVAQALAQAFRNAFADIASSFLSAGFMSLIGMTPLGPFASTFGGSKSSGGSKSFGLIDAGEGMSKAAGAYGKGYI